MVRHEQPDGFCVILLQTVQICHFLKLKYLNFLSVSLDAESLTTGALASINGSPLKELVFATERLSKW